jgi:hypothetical protein
MAIIARPSGHSGFCRAGCHLLDQSPQPVLAERRAMFVFASGSAGAGCRCLMVLGVNLVVVANEAFLETPHAFRSSVCENRDKFVDIHAGMAFSGKATNSAGLDVRSDFDNDNRFGLALSIYFLATFCVHHDREWVARHHRRIQHCKTW